MIVGIPKEIKNNEYRIERGTPESVFSATKALVNFSAICIAVKLLLMTKANYHYLSL